MIGQDEHSWGLSHNGLLWHNGQSRNYTTPFGQHSFRLQVDQYLPNNQIQIIYVPIDVIGAKVIGMLFDGVKGTLTYFKDGIILGVAFRGLHRIKEPLYPMVCSTMAKTEITLCIHVHWSDLLGGGKFYIFGLWVNFI